MNSGWIDTDGVGGMSYKEFLVSCSVKLFGLSFIKPVQIMHYLTTIAVVAILEILTGSPRLYMPGITTPMYVAGVAM